MCNIMFVFCIGAGGSSGRYYNRVLSKSLAMGWESFNGHLKHYRSRALISFQISHLWIVIY